ncbi:MAG: NAD(P)H-quinone oxidoreductase [Methyloligellaceae bacterium]
MNTAIVPDQMQAIAIDAPGAKSELVLKEVPTPVPTDEQILIKVSAAGVNRPDVLQRLGHYPPPPGASERPGLEVAGEVVKCGLNAKRYKPGDKVCALVSGGGYSQYCLAHEGSALPIPENITEIEAAGIPETAFTVWHNTFQRGNLKSGEWFLVHGGASGIATTAIQFAAAIGAKVITTVSSEEKAEFCLKLGATKAINYTTEDFPTAVKEITDGNGADVILDMIGGDYIERNMKCAAQDGRIVQIAFLNGPIAEINFNRLMINRLTLTGSTLRPRTDKVKTEIAKAVESNVWPMIKEGKFKPVIDSTFPLEKAGEAHKRMESRGHIGKIILTT